MRKRAELVSEIEGFRSRMNVLLVALDHVDAAIRVFKPDVDVGDLPERPVPPANAAFRGEVQHFLLTILRRSGEPMTTTELGLEIMSARELDRGDRVLGKLIRARTGQSLANLRRKGFVESLKFGTGAELEWRLTARGQGGDVVGGWRNGTTKEQERLALESYDSD